MVWAQLVYRGPQDDGLRVDSKGVGETTGLYMEHSMHRIAAIFHMKGPCGEFIQCATSFLTGIGGESSFDPEMEQQVGPEENKLY